MCKEFGIVTGPRNKNIPDSIYDMPELQNNPKRQKSGRASKRARMVSIDPPLRNLPKLISNI